MATTPKNKDPDEEKAKVEQQKKAAREPHEGHGKDTPAVKPPQSGKPIWDKPHSK